jgi:cytochrome P450
LAQHFCPNPLMVFGGGALFTGVRYIQVPRRANVEDTDRVLMTTMGGTVAVAGVVLLKDIMTFGDGPHFCIGAQLTRLEAKLAMEILLQRFERLTLREPEVDWIDSYFARGPKQLPVEFRTSRI